MSLPAVALLAAIVPVMPELTTSVVVVFALVLVAVVLFVSEIIPVDLTAIALIVLVVLLEPWTGVSPEEGLAGFASQATITVLAMFILSEGIRRTGLLQIIGDHLFRLTRGRPRRQLAALVGLSGSTAGVVNNTPVVAMMIPMAVNLANRSDVSPSRYLIPISFAAMMGGMLTLVGTSTNLLASDVSARLLDRPFGMFEFTQLGFLVLLVGTAYLLLVGWRLTPERIRPRRDPIDLFEMDDYLAELTVQKGSSMAGRPVPDAVKELDMDLEILRIRRGDRVLTAPLSERRIQAGDVLIVRTDPSTLRRVLHMPEAGLRGGGPVPHRELGVGDRDDQGNDNGSDADEDPDAPRRALVELVVLSGTLLVGETLQSLNFAQRYQAWVLAIRRGSGILHTRLNQVKLAGGDTLLVQASPEAVQRLNRERNFVVSREIEPAEVRGSKTLPALAIMVGVVVVAGTGLASIVTASLAGVVAMVLTGCLKPVEIYPAVDWHVIFLLAGVIPLGMALERSGGGEFLAETLVSVGAQWPPLLVLFLFYLLTAVVTNLISNNASIVLMLPVAVNAALLMDANAFAFVMAVTFASSTALLSPVGYQTNLMVYGPGGYRFTDFFRVGAPLQLLLAGVTSLGIWAIWGL